MPDTAAPQDPYRAMLRGGAVPALAVGAVAVALSAVLRGGLGAAGAVAATALVVAVFASSVVLLRRTSGLDPRVVFMVAMVSYTAKVTALLVFLILFRDADWMSPSAFGLTAIVVSLAWTVGEVVAFARVRTLVHDALPGGPAGAPAGAAPEVRYGVPARDGAAQGAGRGRPDLLPARTTDDREDAQ